MLSVELDIYSGRPNPEWPLSEKEEQDLVDRLVAEPSLMLPIDADTGGLGYRGYLIRAMSEDEGAWRRSKLPSQFRLGGQYDPNQVAALWLLDTAEKPDTAVDDYLREYTQGAIQGAEPVVVRETAETETGILSCRRLFTDDRDFSFWNTPSVLLRNNAYNFAANNRTGTLAQPGRRSGRIYPRIDIYEVAAAALRDGFQDGCPLYAPSVLTALFIATTPSFTDFHWYRLCQNNHWCHKPGVAPARNTDNRGRWITEPRQADRGPYTTFVGFYYGRNPVPVQ